jgi:quinol monooxygenase YgiN
MIVVHASFPLDPDRREEALDHVETLVERSRAEAGTVEYRATTDVTEPNVVRFLERYEDAAAFEAHTGTDHFRAFQEALPDYLAGDPEITRFEVESATELEL